jgi:hypothetical protein
MGVAKENAEEAEDAEVSQRKNRRQQVRFLYSSEL